MIYRIFCFFNELDVLEIKLATEYNFVDKFIIIESSKTHSNNPKEYILSNNIERFKKWLNKIEIVKVDFDEHMEKHPDLITRWEHPCWQRESFQRNYAKVYLEGRVNEDDVVISSDCDEILSKEVLDSSLELLKHHNLVMINQPLFINKINLYHTDASSMRVMRGSLFNSNYLTTITLQRNHPTVYGGWHFSYLYATQEEVFLKLKSFSHAYEKEWVKDAGEAFCDMKKMKIKYIPIEDLVLPQYLKDNLEKFNHHIYYV